MRTLAGAVGADAGAMQDDATEDSFERGAALQRAKRFAEAIEVYERAAAKALTVNLAINLGVCLGELGERARAEHYLALAKRHRPTDPNILRLMGNAYAESGRTQLAEQEFLAA